MKRRSKALCMAAVAQTGGALVGGTLGVISGSGQSGSNRALRGIAGGVAGQQLGRMASNRPVFEYTILIGGRDTITMVSDEEFDRAERRVRLLCAD